MVGAVGIGSDVAAAFFKFSSSPFQVYGDFWENDKFFEERVIAVFR